jgi:methylenetetrahydrofolate reductase (NADPH)
MQPGKPLANLAKEVIMSAPINITPTPTALMDNPLGAFLRKASVEITAKQIDKIAMLRGGLSEGATVFVALIDAGDREGQIEAVAALRSHGFNPVPHIPARFIVNEDDLKRRLDAFVSRAKVTDVLALGGGAPEPIGKFDAAIQILETSATLISPRFMVRRCC